ncbi:hypothetical protein [Sphingomonas sp.]|uniref:hypothetical protein n=1 Tax=Sphingomonas sp. TaxID=28214 RepID=UPI000DBBD518|nr:hypothetical protein [Sphingomonas sp.]PZT93973.1 MAG: hypothetical protein DI625_07410 [Sphingomonas sp.]
MTLRRFPTAALPLVAAAMVSGCSDPKEPSAEAFRPALEAQVRDRFCSAIDVMPYEIEGEGGDTPFPIVTSPSRGMAGPGSDGMSVAMLDAFVEAGLATRTAFEKPARWKGASDRPFVRQPLLSYAPAEKGAAYLRAIEHQATREKVAVPSFCVAKGELVDVVRWTEPVGVPGRMTSRVTYTYRGVDPVSFMSASDRKVMARPKEAVANFELQSDGWRPMAR